MQHDVIVVAGTHLQQMLDDDDAFGDHELGRMRQQGHEAVHARLLHLLELRGAAADRLNRGRDKVLAVLVHVGLH